MFFHSPALADNHARQNQLENYLLQAVRNNDLLLYFQPKVSMKTQRWVGAEALLRWKHPVLGEFSNETLIHMAEQNGLIFEVGHFVLHQALKAASDWLAVCPTFCIAINVSSVQLKKQWLCRADSRSAGAVLLPCASVGTGNHRKWPDRR